MAAVSAGVIGPFSVPRTFWTGPVCAGFDLQPPALLAPADGDYVEDPSPLLDFEYPQSACLQEWFSIEVSPEPHFATEALHATLGPATEYETAVNFLTDCTLYYWRAKAVFGEDISGPYSAVSAFYADFTGACAPHTGLPRLSGVVWLDVCTPGDGGTPPGCVWQEGGLAPDGVRQDGEAVLPGLLVRIAPGVCTSPDMGWTTGPTEADGDYSQTVLPGTYCVWIFRDKDGNQDVLGSGRWTHPPGGYDSPVRYEVAIDWGEERPDLDFGWWRRQAGRWSRAAGLADEPRRPSDAGFDAADRSKGNGAETEPREHGADAPPRAAPVGLAVYVACLARQLWAATCQG